MPVKNNLAPMGRGLAFRMEQRLLPGEIVASSVAFDITRCRHGRRPSRRKQRQRLRQIGPIGSG